MACPGSTGESCVDTATNVGTPGARGDTVRVALHLALFGNIYIKTFREGINISQLLIGSHDTVLYFI